MQKSEVLSPYPSVPIRTHPYLSVPIRTPFPGFKQAARAAGAARESGALHPPARPQRACGMICPF